MENNNIEPHKVTKPIQLLAAWLVGLVLVNGAFLATSSGIENPVWLKATLIIAAVINVPLFLGAIFLLQTKFRPELQEDSYYSKYLDNATNEYVTVTKDEEMISLISDLRNEIVHLEKAVPAVEPPEDAQNIAIDSWDPWKVALCDLLPDFEEIRTRLKTDRIPIEKIFGSANTDNLLDVNVISISRSVDFSTTVKVLRKMVDYKFDGYCYSISTSKVNREEIYLGGFGYMNGGYFPINEELKNLLKSDLEKSDLEYFEAKHPSIKIPNKPSKKDALERASS